MKYSLFLALGFAVLVIVSCKKDKKPEATKPELLTASLWKYDTAGIDLNSDGVIDTAFPQGTIEACEKDNTATFVSNGTGTADEGATKCDDSDAQSTSFTWTLSSDEKTLTFSGALFNLVDGDVKLLELSSSAMTISKLVEISSGYSATVVVKLKH